MQELKLVVPTYLYASVPEHGANSFRDEFRARGMAALSGGTEEISPTSGDRPDFGPPFIPVLAHEAEGVRVVLGTHDWQSGACPDIQIERRPKGWAIFLHPVGGCDASGYVYFLDDGRSFVEIVRQVGPTPALEILKRGVLPHELDRTA